VIFGLAFEAAVIAALIGLKRMRHVKADLMSGQSDKA